MTDILREGPITLGTIDVPPTSLSSGRQTQLRAVQVRGGEIAHAV